MFSVIIPLYDKQSTIKNTINSVLMQSFQDFEIVIVNDGSTDGSVGVVNSINDSRVRVVHQNNQGVSAARNTGIREAKHNWLALLDGDDEWDVDYLETLYLAIKDDPDCIAYCTGYRRIDARRGVIDISWSAVPEKRGRLSNYFKSAFFSSPVITSSTVCLNKVALRAINLEDPFPARVKSGEDLDVWVRIALKGNVYFVNGVFATINVAQARASLLSERLGGEFNYRKWFWYKADAPEKQFWLIMYSLKKIYKVFRKKALIKNRWLLKYYIDRCTHR